MGPPGWGAHQSVGTNRRTARAQAPPGQGLYRFRRRNLQLEATRPSRATRYHAVNIRASGAGGPGLGKGGAGGVGNPLL